MIMAAASSGSEKVLLRSSVQSWAAGVEDGHIGEVSVCGDEEDEVACYVERAIKASVDDVTPAGRDSVLSALSEVAHSEQRMVVANCRRTYVRGRAHIDVVYKREPMIRQRRAVISGYMQMTSLEDEHIYRRLRDERVVTRLSAPTGMGKTRKFPAEVAKRCDKRVCLVVLDAHQAKMASKAAADRGVPVSSSRWRREPGAFVSVHSYSDFCGIVRSAGRKRFFSDFDVFMFDEPQNPLAPVWAASQLFAAYAMPTNSLVLLSATVSSNPENDLTAKRVGSFSVEPVPGGFQGLLESGKLVSQYLTDRTLVLVAGDRDVNRVAKYYEEMALDVRVLDGGSSEADVDRVNVWLRPTDSVVPRVVVAHESYGTGYNLFVSYVITSATRRVYLMDGVGGLIEKEIPLREVEVKQHCGRTGRGLVDGSGGIVASKVRDTSLSDMLKCESLHAYLLLLAANVQPTSDFDEVKKLLPKGLNPDVATAILSIHLPPALVIRYLGSDGRIASRFAKAMNLYAQPDCFVHSSVDVDPVGYGEWIEEKVGGYFEGDVSSADARVRVPFASPESLKVIMHTLYAVSRGWLTVEKWRPVDYGDVDSDDEELGVRGNIRKSVRPVPLRLVKDEPVQIQPVVIQQVGWSYDVSPERLAIQSRRRAMSWLNSSDAEHAVASLRMQAESGDPFGPVTAQVEAVKDDSGLQKVKVKQTARKQPVDVRSPGGTVFMTVHESVYDDMVNARVLHKADFVKILEAVSESVEGFVKSTLFDNYSNVWVCLLQTMGDSGVVRHVVEHGFSALMSKLLSSMYDRFRADTLAVCATSNYFREQLSGYFQRGGKPSMTKLRKYLTRGNAPIAQSTAFVQRLMELSKLHVAAVQCFEGQSLFDPGLVTRLQEPLPVQNRVVMPVLGDGVVVKSGEERGIWNG